MEFIIIGLTFWFLAPTIVVSCILFYCVAEENPGFAIITTIVYIALIQFCSNFNFIDWISLNTGQFIKYIGAYIVIGVIFSVVKYWFYLTDKRRTFDRTFQEFLSDKKISKEGYTFDSLPEQYQGDCYNKMSGVNLPNISMSTRYITFWMGYWPLVGIWTIINNPLKWLWEELKFQLTGLFKTLHYKLIGNRQEEFDKWRDKKFEKNNR